MYHFVAEQTAELRLSQEAVVSSEVTQYLKGFQIEALRFLYNQLARHEFCILNDESGLGKSATIAALLSGIAANKKTLIVVQNDEQLLLGWEFHFGVLTELPVCIIQNSQDSTASTHNIYLAKWSVLRSIGDLSKLKFDLVIVDHRGYMLNNSFCTSMLLRHFEKKVNIVVSSVDVTSDVKLLHNVLRLGGRLEHQYKNFQSFDQKFRLPDTKEVFSKKVDLEVYYRQREILGDLVKDFRLRRYRHQYDQNLPFVTPEQYKINLTVWLASSNNSNNTLSSGTTSEASIDLRSTAGTQEILECLISIKKERQEKQQNLANLRECSEVLEPSEEPVAMSPLIFESSESDVEHEDPKSQTIEQPIYNSTYDEPVVVGKDKLDDDIVQLSSDDCEVVTPTKRRKNTKTKRFNACQHTQELNTRRRIQSNEQVLKQPSTSKSCTRSVSLTSQKFQNKTSPEAKTPGKTATKETSDNDKETNVKKVPLRRSRGMFKNRELKIAPPGVHSRETRGMQRLTRSADQRLHSKYKATSLALNIDKKFEKKRFQSNTPTRSKDEKLEKNIVNSKKSPASKKEKESSIIKKTKVRIAKTKYSRKSEEEKNQETTNTRISPRSTMTKESPTTSKTNESQITSKLKDSPITSKARGRPKISTAKETHSSHKTLVAETKKSPRILARNKKSEIASVDTTEQAEKFVKKKQLNASRLQQIHKVQDKPADKTSQMPLLSASSNSDYEDIQCGQRLPQDLRSISSVLPPHFLIPATPNTATPQTQLEFSTTTYLNDSDILLIANTAKQSEIMVLSSSQEESSSLSNSTVAAQSRRTRALKHKKQQHPPQCSGTSIEAKQQNRTSFGELLANQTQSSQLINKSHNKSPDLFSNCSDILTLPLTQEKQPAELTSPATSAPFEGFKIFGSEVKQFQQQHAKTQRNTGESHLPATTATTNRKSERSCLDILERMFEKRGNTQQSGATKSNVMPTYPIELSGTPQHQQQQTQSVQQQSSKLPFITHRRRTLFDDEDIFEISNNAEFGNRLRLNSAGDVSPIPQQSKSMQPNKITNYLIGSGGTTSQVLDEDQTLTPGNRSGSTIPSHRKSPKSSKLTQVTKLTRWFAAAGASTVGGSCHSAPTTPISKTESAVSEIVRSARRSGPTKRKRLDLFK